MPDSDWSDRLYDLLQALARSDGDAATLRSLLFGLHELLRSGQVDVQNAFQSVAADDLAAGRELAETLSSGRYVAPVGLNDVKARVTHAATVLRGLEAALIGLGELARAPRRSGELSVSYGDARGWLLPFPPKFRDEPGDWPPYFAKRALTKLRCINSELPDGMRVDLQLVDAIFGNEISAAACLFESLNLKDQAGKPITDNTTGPFLVAGIEGRHGDALKIALESCCDPEGAADIVVFPELSITTDEQLAISRLLRIRPWDKGLVGPRPQMVVAGSWHEADDTGRMRNRATVLDGSGTVVGRHSKHMVYGTNHAEGVFKESVAPSEEILVLASPTLTVALAICLDFCQTARSNPYHDLDVDLVVVTSLADENTTVQHAQQAQVVWARRKTGTFLAQQDNRKPFGVSGATPAADEFVQTASAPVKMRKLHRPG